MAEAVWPEGLGRQVLDTVDSTNGHALRMAPELRGPMWFLGLTQTAGRGRRARPWVSPRGNFYATLLLHPQEAPETVALRSFAAALALRDAFVTLTGLPDSFRLKWPNDVLLNGAKVAGILLESSGAAGKVDHLAIGIGVNLIAHPDPSLIEPGAVPAVSLLSETGLRLAPEAFLDVLAPAYARREAQFQSGGFAPLRADWLARAARLGETIIARTGTAEWTGRFEGIDEGGSLILTTAAGRQSIPAADVFF